VPLAPVVDKDDGDDDDVLCDDGGVSKNLHKREDSRGWPGPDEPVLSFRLPYGPSLHHQ
jgi:hypothetical protein